MSRAKTILKDLGNLDLYIQSLIRRRDRLSASLLSSPRWSADKVKGGLNRKQDDVYVELLDSIDEIDNKTVEAIQKRRELQNMIDSLEDTASRTILSLVYIDKMSMYEVMDEMVISERTYFRLKKAAQKDLENADITSHSKT